MASPLSFPIVPAGSPGGPGETEEPGGPPGGSPPGKFYSHNVRSCLFVVSFTHTMSGPACLLKGLNWSK